MNTDDDRWNQFLLKAKKTLLAERGRQARVADNLDIRRPDLNRILQGKRLPGAGLALRLFDQIEKLNYASTHYTSDSYVWGTPLWLFKAIDRVFHFTVDAAASEADAKCRTFFSKEIDGLKQTWTGHRVWLNPPYGREAPKWCQKAFIESRENGALVVLLLASRSSTNWWHDFVLSPGNQVIPLRGRLTFEGAENCAPFSSVLVVMPPFGKQLKHAEGLEARIEKARLEHRAAAKPGAGRYQTH